MPVIAEEELYQKIKMDGPDPNWDLIKLGIIKKYPNKSNQINELIAGSKIGYYQNKNAWDSYAAAATDYMKVYGNTASAIQLNDMAWHVFTSVKETDYLNNALEWSRLSLRDDSGNGAFMDTYANLLYKLGKKNEAIQYEQKALSLVPEADKPNYVQTLEKMKSGQKTWD
jgi:tetratricopeptide (TPR) repeat protein